MGANPTEGHPVVGARIKQATLRGMKLVVDRPAPHRAVPSTACCTCSPRPGTNAAVMHGLAHVVHRDGLMDLDYLARAAPRAGPRSRR